MANTLTLTYDDLLFVGAKGRVRALYKRTGETCWTTNLPDSGSSIVTMLYEDGLLYAASKGRLYAIDPASGDIMWRNNLPKLGYGHVVLATIRQSTDLALLKAQLEQEGAQGNS